MASRRRKDGSGGLTLVWPGKTRPLRGDSRFAPEKGLAPANDLTLVERVDAAAIGGAPHRKPALPLAPAPATTGAGPLHNRLIFGDNRLAMEALLEHHAGRIDLIYIDPPYATGVSYYSQTGRSGAAMERRAYRDAHAGGMAGYAQLMYERLALMHELLADGGAIFVHCDWRANAVLRLLLDEVFGPECFRNEIVWRRAPNLGRQAASKQLGRVIDTIFVYSKREGANFPGPVPRRRAPVELDGKGKPKGARWDEARETYFTTAPRGDYTDDSIARLREEGRVYDSSAGKVYIKYFLTRGDDGRWYKEQPVDALWDDFDVRPLRHRPKAEAMGYDTQKPEGLLERIIRWASRPGDVVADFFAGSGTTAAVAHDLGRRFIACDDQRTAIEIARGRLIARGASFEVCSVVRRERRCWAEGVVDDARALLEAYGAEPAGGRWGTKHGARVYVGPVAEAMSDAAIDAVCREAGGGRVTVLAWEWCSHDAASLRKRVKAEHDVELSMRTIPPELMRTTAGAPAFLERPEVELELVADCDPRLLAVRLLAVRVPQPERFSEDKSNKGNKDEATPLTWADFVDSWRVDFEGRSDVFAPTWQATREGTSMALVTPFHRFTATTRVTVKVLTVFGDEIDRTIRVEC